MWKKWKESKERRAKLDAMIVDLVELFEQVNARQLGLIQYMVASGILSSEVAVAVAEIETLDDVRKMLRTVLEKASSELGENLSATDFNA